jgi:hypothetical protein
MCGMKPARLIELLSRGDELPVQLPLKERRRDRSEEKHDVMDEQVQLVRPALACWVSTSTIEGNRIPE